MEQTSEAENGSRPEGKWICDSCTFENWMASSKCTMCFSVRSTQVKLAVENIHNTSSSNRRKSNSPPNHGNSNGGNDIFKLGSSTGVGSVAPLPATPSAVTSSFGSGRSSSPLDMLSVKEQIIHYNKWSCLMCTFLNWPRSVRCYQCLYPRRRMSPVVSRNSSLSPRSGSSSSSHHQQYNNLVASPPPNLEANNNLTNAHPLVVMRPPSASPPPATLSPSGMVLDHHLVAPRELDTVPESKSEQERPEAEATTTTTNKLIDKKNKNNSSCLGDASVTNGSTTGEKKWNCPACTYDNWPRSMRCIICGLSRSEDVVVVQASTSGSIQSSLSPTARRNNENSSDHLQQQRENNCDYEKRLRQLRRRLRETDWNWLTACLGVVEGDVNPVEAYLNSGGDPTRKLTNPETALLNCNRSVQVFETGHTLVHLAIKMHREDMLATLLSQLEGGGGGYTSGGGGGIGIKCVPSYVAPDLASGIRRHISQSVRQRKGLFPCYYLSEWATYSMPSEIQDLPPVTQEQLYSEVMDKDAQKELEEDCEDCSSAINWSEELTITLGSRLHALWNRSAGDCLLDSVLQATWGVFDRDNALRRAMADSLHEAGHLFYPRWKAWELQQAMESYYTLDDTQLSEDWSGILSLASKPGASLEQVHVFCLAHVLRRPIIVYGVKYVKSWRGENLGYARFEGVYLPLIWEPSFCSKSPIALGYTRGHFCALVPPEPVLQTLAVRGAAGAADAHFNIHPGPSSTNDGCFHSGSASSGGVATPTGGGGNCTSSGRGSDHLCNDVKTTFLPLVTADRKQFLPIPYLSQGEAGNEEAVLRRWLDVRVTDTGLVVALQNMTKPPLLVAQMTEEWLNHYRKLAQSSTAPFSSRPATTGSSNMNNIRRARRTSPRSGGSRSPSCSMSPAVPGPVSPVGTNLSSASSPSAAVGGSQPANNNSQLTQSCNSTSHNLAVHNQIVSTCYSSDGDSDEE